MKERFAEWLGKAREIESAIQTRIEGVASAARPPGAAAARQALEIVHALVHVIEREVQPAGRGQVVFPYTQVRVWMAASSPRDRARLEAACEGPPSIDDRIGERLAAARCEVAGLRVKVTFVTQSKPGWIDPDFHVEYARATPASDDSPSPGRLDLTVLHGTAERSGYTFTSGSVSIGRGVEVRDSRDRLIRTNQVAFVEGGGDVNASVSRCHARIEREASTGVFRLYDDGASHGTSVIREGRGLPVPRGRGLRLRSGDVIALGQARLRVRLQDGGG